MFVPSESFGGCSVYTVSLLSAVGLEIGGDGYGDKFLQHTHSVISYHTDLGVMLTVDIGVAPVNMVSIHIIWRKRLVGTWFFPHAAAAAAGGVVATWDGNQIHS